MKRFARFLSLFLTLGILCGLLALPASAASDVVSAPDAENGIFYVDDANCLSDTTKNYINSQNIALTNACGGQVAVVTIPYLNDLNAQEYAIEVFNSWGVGDSHKNNGTVFLLVTEEKKCWAVAGTGIDDELTDSTLGNILEGSCYDDLDAGNYDRAVYNTVKRIFAWYQRYYNVDLSSYSSTRVTSGRAGWGGGAVAGIGYAVGSLISGVFQVIIMLIVLVIVLVFVFGSMRRPGFWCFGGPSWCWPGPRGPRGPWGRGPRDPWGPGGGHRGPGGFGGPGSFGGFGGGRTGGGGAGRGGGFGGGFGGGHTGGGGAGRR